ncbi:hypothetical protein HBI75_204740 [Parastagonospora nodorum]|nr:hypothetical protein HBI75_204740 [Parastagonospora nodorum]
MNNLEEKVASWRTETCNGVEKVAANDIIAQFFGAILSCLRVIIKSSRAESPEPPYYQSLERSAATLLIWGGDHDVSHGGLDNYLQHPGYLRDTVFLTLISIGDILGRTSPSSTSSDKGFQDAWDDSIALITALTETAKYALGDASDLYVDDATIETDMTELSRGLSVYVKNLTRLSRSLECPAAYGNDMLCGKEMDYVQAVQDIPVHQNFAALIAARFPTAKAELVDSLGRSNWSRYLHVQRQRKTAQMQTQVAMGEDTKTQFHDSGFASARSRSQHEHSIYATSVVSSLAEASHRRLPLLPKQARLGESFTCEVCDRKITVRCTRDWKTHVFHDLCAYTCIFPLCPSAGTLFEKHTMVVDHIEEKHCRVPGLLEIVCPLCSEHVEGPTAAASNHLARHMEEIALGVLPAIVEVEDDSETTSRGSGAKHDTSPAAHPVTEIETLVEPTLQEDIVGTIVDELDETGSNKHSSIEGSMKPEAHLKQLNAQVSEQKPLDGDGLGLKAAPVSMDPRVEYYWVCCNCGYDSNSYELNTGCSNDCGHWRTACCRFYSETYPRGR